MKEVLKATAILSSSSVVVIVVGLFSAKAFALLIGPSGVGFIGLLQSIINLGSLVAGMGIGTGLVRMGADALAQGQEEYVITLRRAAWLLFWVLGAVGVMLLLTFRQQVHHLFLADRGDATTIIWLSVAILFNIATTLQSSTLNTYHRITALAQLAVMANLASASATLSIIGLWREGGIVAAVIASSAMTWLVSRLLLQKTLKQPTSAMSAPLRGSLRLASRTLLRFGFPYTLSMLAGYGVQLIMPVVVLNLLGSDSVGYHRAAMTVSVTLLGFLLTAMAQDYFPRLSGASQDTAKLIVLVNQQHRLVLRLALPLILGMLVFAPLLIPLIYSVEFLPTVGILQWQLIGDILKFSSWTMAFVVLVRRPGFTYFFTELIAGSTLFLASWLGIRYWGLRGLGFGYLMTYLIYYFVLWAILRRDIHFSWDADNLQLLGLSCLVALGLSVMPLFGWVIWQRYLGLLFVSATAVWTGSYLIQEYRKDNDGK